MFINQPDKTIDVLLGSITKLETHMRRSLFLIAIAFTCAGNFWPETSQARGSGKSGGSVSVKGYFRKDGTYVAPHHRSGPDGSFYNNWSTRGNINPYTGEEGKVDSPRPGTSYVPNIAPYAPLYVPSPVTAPSASPPATLPSALPELPPQTNSIPSIPANAKLNIYGNDWECVRGFRRTGSECAPVQLSENSKLNVFGNDWECQRGFRQSGSECVQVQLPANAKLNVFGNDWECQRGYRQSGSECVAVQLPQNAKLNVFGNDWECQRGFRQSGSMCVPVEVPSNAKLTVFGNDWECTYGYRRNGNECIPVGM